MIRTRSRTQRIGRSQGLARRAVVFLCVLPALCVLVARPTEAQPQRPKADVRPLVERAGARPGETIKAALRISLPEGLHTQSNKPRDPLLIPTELTVDAPAGITVKEIVWPTSTDLKQAGQDQPLAVFEQTFAIGVQLDLAASLPPGAVAVPLHLRYQACDANLCYAPSTASAKWTFNVAGTGTATGGASDPIFATIAFGKGEAPGAAAAPAATASVIRRPGAAGSVAQTPRPATASHSSTASRYSVRRPAATARRTSSSPSSTTRRTA